jgi:hypothetical protein
MKQEIERLLTKYVIAEKQCIQRSKKNELFVRAEELAKLDILGQVIEDLTELLNDSKDTPYYFYRIKIQHKHSGDIKTYSGIVNATNASYAMKIVEDDIEEGYNILDFLHLNKV